MAKALRKREQVEAPQSGEDTSRKPIEFGPLNHRLGYALRRAQLAVFHDFFDAFAKMDIKPAQYSVLTIIESNPGLPQGRVAEALGIQKTNFVVMIACLERRELVMRKPSKHDRRIYSLFLTREGSTLMAKLHDRAQRHEERIMERVGHQTYNALFAPLRLLAEQ